MTEIVHCPACSGRDVRAVEEWPLGKKHRAAACGECGLLFVHPQPSPETLQAYYAPDGRWRAKRAAKEANAQTRTKGGAPAMMAALDRHFPASRPPAGARVLDFGCGTGAWLNSFQDCGWETSGVEPSSDAAFVRHQRLPAVPSDGRFDLVIAYHVLEHLPRPLDTLRELSQAIRPEGHCLVSVPRLDTVAVHRDVGYCLQSRTHIVAYTEACLRGLLARAGLTTVAALHDLDAALTKGAPIRLRLVARKTATVTVEPDPAAALRPILETLPELRISA
jgi:SAM-dependent methyltransferase